MKHMTVVRWGGLAWAAALVAAFAARSVSPAGLAQTLGHALSGPYDASTMGAVWLGHARALAVAVLVLASAGGWGLGVGRWLGTRDGQARLGLGLLALGLATFAAGLLGLLAPACLAALLLVPGRGLPGVPARAWRAAREAVARAPVLALAAGAFPLLYLALALTPELGWDALTYHLRAPSHYLAARRIHPLMYSPASFYPFLAEMWSLLAMAFGGDGAAKLVNFAFLPLTMFALAEIGGALAGPRAGWLAALLFAGMPAAGALAGQTYNDLETAWLVLLATRLALSRGAAARAASGALCGAALGCKYTGAWALPACAVLWWRAGGGEGGFGARLRAFALPLAAAAVAGGAWPVRTWGWTGNPVYPLLTGWFRDGWNPYLTAEQAAKFIPGAAPAGPVALAVALARFPWDASVAVTAIGFKLSPLLAGFLPGLLLPRVVPPSPVPSPPLGGRGLIQITALALAGAWQGTLWAAASAGEGRYLLPAASLLAAPAAAGALRLAAGSFGAAAAVAAVVALGLAAQAAHWTEQASRLYVPWRVAAGLEPRESHLNRGLLPNGEYIPMTRHLNATLPKAARVLYASDILSYYIERDVIFDMQQIMPPVAVRVFARCVDPAAQRRWFRQRGIGWVLYSVRVAAFERACRCVALPREARACLRDFWRRYAEPAGERGGLRLYRLKSEREAATAPPPPWRDWPLIQDPVFDAADEARQGGDPAKARALLEAFRREAPELAGLRVKLALASLELRDPKRAARELVEARALGADSGEYWMTLASVRAAAKDRPGAYEAAREGAARWPAARPQAVLAAHAWNAGQPEEARRAARRALALMPGDREVQRIAAQLR